MTKAGITLPEQYQSSFDKDYRVFGELNRYGMKSVQFNGRSGRICADEYGATEAGQGVLFRMN